MRRTATRGLVSETVVLVCRAAARALSFGQEHAQGRALAGTERTARITSRRLLVALVAVLFSAACGAGASDTDSSAPIELPIVTVLAAGDIGDCVGAGDEATAALLTEHPDVPILALGDLAYESGTSEEFATCFGSSWGAHKARIYPVPGNHEYHQAGAAPYFAYFSSRAGENGLGHYSFDLGAWHLVALNSERDLGEDGAQLRWLRADLAANKRPCVLAFLHKPRFTMADYDDDPAMQPFWSALAGAGAEVVLTAHDHNYQRYKPLNAAGKLAADGTRQFVVGTGGGGNLDHIRPDTRRDAASGDTLGLLELTLRPDGYDWRFLPVAGQTFTDSGSGGCR